MTTSLPDNHKEASSRLARLGKWMAEQKLDAFCVRNTTNIAYLTQFENVFDEEQAHALLVRQDGTALLHTDSRYAAACRDAAKGTSIEIDDALTADGKLKTHAQWIFEQITNAGCAHLGIEDSISLAEFRRLEKERANTQFSGNLVETTSTVASLRSVKDVREVALLRAAQAITDAAFAHMVQFMKPGMTEREVQMELDDFMRKQGTEGLAFPSIVATGPNGANPHAQPGNTKLEAGQCVVMDFGAKKSGYCSDMTRMVFIGQPDPRLAHAYEVLREANESVEAMLKPGITGAEAHAHALEVLEAGGFGGRMGHGLGHGVGMEVHEEPVLAPRNTEPLVAGNVVTVEPGIYFEGEFGMRLEDFGVITDEGFDVFTQTSHDLVII